MSTYILFFDIGSFIQTCLFAVKATSTLCILWSAYLFARMRLFPRRDLDIENDIDRKKGKYEHNNELEISPSCSNYPTEQFDDQNLSSFSHLKDSVIIRNIVNTFYGLIYGVKNNDTDNNYDRLTKPTETDVRNVGLIEESTSSELIFWYQVISNLTTKAGLSTNTTYSTSRKRRSRLLSFSKHPKLTTDYLLQLLVSYSKDQKFLNLLYESEHFEKLIDWLGVISLNALNKSDINVSVVEKYNDPPSVNQLLFDRDYSKNRLCNPESEKSNSSFTVIDNVPSAHPEYPIHVLVANFLANISQHPSSCIFKNLENMNKLLALWEISPSLHLNLLGAKIDHNLKVHSRLSDKSSSTFQKEINQQSCNSPNSLPIYCPDVYKLNISKDINEDYDFDIVFVNGMLGSVFYTWRQHDSVLTKDATQYTKCWPRDWLSRQFPRGRIIGVDTSLKPFIWHSICPLQKLRRTLDKRAIDIMEQLRKAEVGRRPIIWITHSAGGILVKEMLRLAGSGNSDNSKLSEGDHSQPNPLSNTGHSIRVSRTYGDMSVLDGENLDGSHQNMNRESPYAKDGSCEWYCHEIDETDSVSKLHNPNVFSVDENKNSDFFNTSTENQLFYSSSCSHALYEDDCDTSLINLSNDSQLNSVNYQDLANSTRAIVFMSTPHRGNQSLFTLYRRPFRWALTPEAIQLERNSNYLLNLHVWFNTWAYRQSVRVLSMAEGRVTPVNRFWSVLLVPEDTRDRDMGELVRIDSDHLYISKPMCPNDLSYTSIVHFIESLPFTSHS